MVDFEDRKKGHEAKFALDQDLQFKANARRNKLLGLWAAKLLKMSDEDALVYALELLRAGFDKEGDEIVFARIRADFDKRNVGQSDHQIRRTMDEFLAKALRKFENN